MKRKIQQSSLDLTIIYNHYLNVSTAEKGITCFIKPQQNIPKHKGVSRMMAYKDVHISNLGKQWLCYLKVALWEWLNYPRLFKDTWSNPTGLKSRSLSPAVAREVRIEEQRQASVWLCRWRKEATNQGKGWQPLENHRSKEVDSLLRNLQKGRQPCWCIDFSISDFHRRIK